MLNLFVGLDIYTGLLLLLALAFVLFYEAINGFHDTANAVATVIYTRAMQPQLAVVMAAFFNFFGVLLGGLSVAYAIVHMLPTDLLLNMGSTHGLAMVFSMLLAAIIWNLGTWFFGLPASSSHTLIGAIIGIGLTNALIMLCISDTSAKLAKLPGVSKEDQNLLKKLRSDMLSTIEYAPVWIIMAVALALGIGTMIGWRRVAMTIGEKIGKRGMTYAQGMAAQMTAAVSIGLASYIGMPVSTTHVLSSAVAGTMVVDGGGLQRKTVTSILMAWVFTLPAAIFLSGGLYWIALQLI